jgi:DNA primase
MALGSRKDLGYFSAPEPPLGATEVILCESAIDALSCSVFHTARLCVSTSGARANPAWLPSLMRAGYAVWCGFDTDETGERMAEALIALHPGVKRSWPAMHDWNDVLLGRPYRQG